MMEPAERKYIEATLASYRIPDGDDRPPWLNEDDIPRDLTGDYIASALVQVAIHSSKQGHAEHPMIALAHKYRALYYQWEVMVTVVHRHDTLAGHVLARIREAQHNIEPKLREA